MTGVQTCALPIYNRDDSFEQNDQEWERTSVDRKRDTLVTNPYENSSPVTLLGGERDRQVLGQLGYDGVKQNVGGVLNYGVTSPGGYQKDEGYASAQTRGSAGAITPEPRQRGVGFTDAAGMGPGEFDQDPSHFTPKHQRHASGMSQGMESPLYDSSMGTHRDAIKSQDIVALMDHVSSSTLWPSIRLLTRYSSLSEMLNAMLGILRSSSLLSAPRLRCAPLLRT